MLKQETTRPAGDNFLQQQERFDNFVDTYNFDRPHEALGQQPPGELYEKSPREFPERLPEPSYPTHDLVRPVARMGDVHLTKRERFFLSGVLGGEHVGLREVDDGRWLVSFMQLDLGHYDARTKRFDPIGLEPMEVTATEPA